MAREDARVDAYIANSAEFARPILIHLRELVHRGCPEVEEGLKWGMPFFMHKGLLCFMAAFKEHAGFGFWKGTLVVPETPKNEAMGHFGRLTSRADLPPDEVLLAYLRKAVALSEAGIRRPRREPSKAKRQVHLPEELAAALAIDQRAKQHFDQLSPSHRREYCDWVGSAKRPETRQRRLDKVLKVLRAARPRRA